MGTHFHRNAFVRSDSEEMAYFKLYRESQRRGTLLILRLKGEKCFFVKKSVKSVLLRCYTRDLLFLRIPLSVLLRAMTTNCRIKGVNLFNPVNCFNFNFSR